MKTEVKWQKKIVSATFRSSVGVILTILMTSTAVANGEESHYFFMREDGVSIYFDLEVASTSAERSRGLMWRKSLAPRTGMLFDFERASRIRMWMKNTFIALDMIFLDEQKTIVYIHHGAQPLSLDIIETPYVARFTVELNAGEVKRYGISVGDALLH